MSEDATQTKVWDDSSKEPQRKVFLPASWTQKRRSRKKRQKTKLESDVVKSYRIKMQKMELLIWKSGW